jgi:hypothetical protein
LASRAARKFLLSAAALIDGLVTVRWVLRAITRATVRRVIGHCVARHQSVVSYVRTMIGTPRMDPRGAALGWGASVAARTIDGAGFSTLQNCPAPPALQK